ncbi:MAG TPA: V-type ATP synthase subunit F [Anaerolineales bacterium]|nr:V-type ATP synthase subunit F [Anaerolineales bacterium]
MSRLIVITRPSLVPGFHLAGVDANGAEDVETAQEMIETWLDKGETGLLAIDDGLFEHLEPALVRRMDVCERMPYLVIPGGSAMGAESSRRQRIALAIRRAIGFHITFKDEGGEGEP